MKKLIFIFITSFALFSCSDSFLDTKNSNNLDVNSFFKTETDLISAVNAAYTPLAGSGLFGLSYLRMFNTLDPYIWWEKPLQGFDQMQFDATNGDVSSMYQYLYFGVFRTSSVLANIDRVKAVINDSTNLINTRPNDSIKRNVLFLLGYLL